MTNGVNFEVWQLQPSTESELVIDCAVPDLANSRGEIESLLVKDAVVAYARSLQHKPFGLLARDLGPYERAEFDRTDGLALSIPRKLRGMGPNEGEVSSGEILDRLPDGAVLVGASGYGKTTLAQELRRQAIERRWSNEGQKLPVEVFLPDIPPDRDSLEVYLCARVTAHCPQVTATAFRHILRRDGVTILGDAFDRVPSERRPQTESALVNFRRDYPKTQLFLFTGPSSQPERFALATFGLHELSDEEQYDLVERFSRLEFLSGPSFWHNATSFLRAICRHPLLLRLTLALYKETGRLPTSIELLFRSWLERLIPRSVPIGRKSDLERLLTSVSNASAFRPITVDEAVALVRGQGFSDDLLQLLIEADALIQRGRTIELQHEALADYLRALDVVRRTPPDAVEHLRSLSLRRGTQLPALLMVTAPNAEMQRLVWAQIITTDITAAITALRYRADISSEYEAAGAEEMSRRYLSEIMEGLELPLEVHFKRLAPRIQLGLVDENVDRLGIAGALSADGSWATYSFRLRRPEKSRSQLGQRTRSTRSTRRASKR